MNDQNNEQKIQQQSSLVSFDQKLHRVESSQIGSRPPIETVGQLPNQSDHGQSYSLRSATADPQVDHLIKNMWDRMRSLEGKYIDLTNYYKQELIQTQNNQKTSTDEADTVSGPGNSKNQSPREGHTLMQSRDGYCDPFSLQLRAFDGPQQTASFNNNQTYQHRAVSRPQEADFQGMDDARMRSLHENNLLHQLRSEKQKFEMNFQQIIDVNGSVREQGDIPHENQSSLKSEPRMLDQIQISENEVIRFNQELQQAFQDIIKMVDEQQAESNNVLNKKQSEMFQLANKHNLPSSFKNDSVAVWYDAKSQVQVEISKIKEFVNQKSISIKSQSFKPNKPNNVDKQDKSEYIRLIEQFESDMNSLSRNTEDYSHIVNQMKNELSQHDHFIKKEQEALIKDQNELLSSIQMYNDMLINRSKHGRADNSASRLTTASNNQYSTPFEKRVSTYQRSNAMRSNSRGANTSVYNQNTSKRSPAYNQSAAYYEKQLRGASKGNIEGYAEKDWHSDLKLIRAKIINFNQSVSSFMTEINQKQNKLDKIFSRMDQQVNQNLKTFLNTHDVNLVKQYFMNTVLTPTETAQILARANINAQAAENQHRASRQPRKSQQQNPAAASQGSRSPLRNNFHNQSSVSIKGSVLHSQNMSKRGTPSRGMLKNNGNLRNSSNSTAGQMRGREYSYGRARADEQRIKELQNNNNSLYGELRRANDRYMDQQVENRKLKDQIQQHLRYNADLRSQLNHSHNQVQNYLGQIKSLKANQVAFDQRRGYGSVSGHELNYYSSQHFDQQQFGSNSLIPRENYPNTQSENYDLEKELCAQIDQFFSSMKLLQRAVNKKEDISQVKLEFENNQRQVQNLSKQLLSKVSSRMQVPAEDNFFTLHQVVGASNYGKNNADASSIRNRSRSSQKQQIPKSLGQSVPTHSRNHKSTGGLFKSTSYNPGKPADNNNGNYSIFRESYKASNASAIEQKVAEPENDKKQNYEKLQLTIEGLQAQKQEMQESLINLQSLVQALKKEQALKNGESEALNQIEFQQQIQKIEGVLEIALKKNQSAPANEGLNNLKEKLVERIGSFEQTLLKKYNILQQRLAYKESELESVKKLFVEKLKELDQNFAEIGDHVMSNQQQNQMNEQTRAHPTAFENASLHLLKQYLSSEAQQIRDQDDEALEQLIATNTQLNEKVEELNKVITKQVGQVEHDTLLEKFKEVETEKDSLMEENLELIRKSETISKDKEVMNQQLLKIKLDKQKAQSDLNKLNQQQHAMQLEHEQKQMNLQASIQEIQAKLDAEVEQRLCAQKESKDTDKANKLLEQDYENIHVQFENEKRERAQKQRQMQQIQNQLQSDLQQKQDQLQQSQQQLEHANQQIEELNQKVEQKQIEVDNQMKVFKDTCDQYEQARSQVQTGNEAEQQKLLQQVNQLGELKTQLETNLKESQDEQVRLRSRLWWMSALQLRARALLKKQLNQQLQEIEQLKTELEQNKDEQQKLMEQQNNLQKELKQKQENIDDQNLQISSLNEESEQKNHRYEQLQIEKEKQIKDLVAEYLRKEIVMKKEVENTINEIQIESDQKINKMKETLNTKDSQIKELKFAVQDAKSAAEIQAREKEDLVAMTVSQEQSKAYLDNIKQKLTEQLQEKNEELEKLQEEKEAVETQRDSAMQTVTELKADATRVQKQHELNQKQLTDQLKLLEETSTITDAKTQELLKTVKEHQQKEKTLKEQIEETKKNEKEAQEKANDLSHELQKQQLDNESLSKQMETQIKLLKTQKDEAVEQQRKTQQELEDASTKIEEFTNIVESNQKQIKKLNAEATEKQTAYTQLNKQLQQAEKNLESQTKSQSKIKDQDKKSQQEIQSLKNQLQQKQKELQAASKEKQELEKQKQELQKQRQDLEAQKQSQTAQFEKQLKQMNDQLSQKTQQLSHMEQNTTDLQQQLEETKLAHEKILETAQKSATMKEKQLAEDMQQEIEDRQAEVETLKAKIKELEERLDQLKDAEETVREVEERIIEIDKGCQQSIKDLQMAHKRDVVKLTRDMRETYERKLDEIKQQVEQAQSEQHEGGSLVSRDGSVSPLAQDAGRNGEGDIDRANGQVKDMKKHVKNAKKALASFLNKFPQSQNETHKNKKEIFNEPEFVPSENKKRVPK